MTKMFERLMGKIDMLKYGIISDSIYQGDKSLMTASFVSELIYEKKANHYLYITLKTSEGVYQSRFFVFSSIAGRMNFVVDCKGYGSKFIDEVALSYLN